MGVVVGAPGVDVLEGTGVVLGPPGVCVGGTGVGVLVAVLVAVLVGVSVGVLVNVLVGVFVGGRGVPVSVGVGVPCRGGTWGSVYASPELEMRLSNHMPSTLALVAPRP